MPEQGKASQGYEVLGFVEGIIGVGLFFKSADVSEIIATGFSQNIDTYTPLIAKHGQAYVDFMVSYGRDVGSVLFMYGVSTALQGGTIRSRDFSSARIILLAVGTLYEVNQVFEHTSDPIDFLIVGIPLLLESLNRVVNSKKFS